MSRATGVSQARRKARVVIEPEPAHWRALLESSGDRPGAEQRRRFRAELSLPVERPIIMTGHQLEFFHPGVLAKYIAAECAAACWDANAAWIGVDQDDNDFSRLSLPACSIDGGLGRRTVSLAPENAGDAAGVAVCMRPAIAPTPPDELTAPLDSITQGVVRITEALERHQNAPSAARQMHAALRELMSPMVSPAPVVFATDLARTSLFRELLERMRRDPSSARDSYNGAVRRHSDADVRPLAARDELPLWRLDDGAPRRRARDRDLTECEPERLAPRGLLMTGLLRLAGADLFIHGTGGAAYDRITDDWLSDWLGAELAPTTMVTADLLLPLPGADADPAESEHRIWWAHHARHDPAALEDDAAARRKNELLDEIRNAKSSGEDPAPHFRAMHDLLDRYREEHRGELEKLKADAHEAKKALAARDILFDRSWPFPLYDDSALAALRERIAGCFD